MRASEDVKGLISLAKVVVAAFVVVLVMAAGVMMLHFYPGFFSAIAEHEKKVSPYWQAPDPSTIPAGTEGDLIRYGRELIVKTSSYIGPLGTISKAANGMNCQNCHLEAGTKPFGNNFGSVASTYPRYRERSGSIESIEKRVNDCFQRSLNGEPIDSLSHEMRAIVAYLQWVGKDVPKGAKAVGSGFVDLKWLERAANPSTGRKLYLQKCQVCHGNNGEGQRLSATSNYIYPPLTGDHSFTTGAGLYRISNFAKYIFANMPHGATHEQPGLTPEESWDIAAYVLSLSRPDKQFAGDWPNLKAKPIDMPFGPYADSFSEQQHKFGPFGPISEFYQSQKK